MQQAKNPRFNTCYTYQIPAQSDVNLSVWVVLETLIEQFGCEATFSADFAEPREAIILYNKKINFLLKMRDGSMLDHICLIAKYQLILESSVLEGY